MANCGDGIAQIVALVPCSESGWRAIFDEGGPVTEPVACWLLVDHDGERHVHPAVAMAGLVQDATLAANYVGVVAPGDHAETLYQTLKG